MNEYTIKVSFDFEIEATNNLNAVEQVEKILFDGNVEHRAQKSMTYISCMEIRKHDTVAH